MIKKEFRTMGHKIAYLVPETSAEFNTFDTSRADAACDEAVNNIVYRSMHPDTRAIFLHGQEEKKDETTGVITQEKVTGVEEESNSWGLDFSNGLEIKRGGEKVLVTNFDRFTKPVLDKEGKQRVKDNVEVTTWDETEEKYYDRVLAMSVALKKFASEDAARAHFQPLIDHVASLVPFDPKATARAERGPVKLPAKYKIFAAKKLATGTVDALMAGITAAIGKTFTPHVPKDGETVKLFTGKYPEKTPDGKSAEVDFSVPDADAEALGKLVQEYQTWKTNQDLAS